jgi:hypothetical protein
VPRSAFAPPEPLPLLWEELSVSTNATSHRIRSISVVGGFLDGARFDLADGLNCFIGARGTGKTTALEFVRYGLDALPGREHQPAERRRIESLVERNLAGGRVEVAIETKDGLSYIITGCIQTLRQNIVKRLGKAKITVGVNDVIDHDEQGYFLRDWIRTCGDDALAGSRDVPADVPSDANLNQRQRWILDQLEQGVEVQRAMVEQKFDVGEKTAKRDLSQLVQQGLIEYLRHGRSGCYRLVRESTFRRSTKSIPSQGSIS